MAKSRKRTNLREFLDAVTTIKEIYCPTPYWEEPLADCRTTYVPELDCVAAVTRAFAGLIYPSWDETRKRWSEDDPKKFARRIKRAVADYERKRSRDVEVTAAHNPKTASESTFLRGQNENDEDLPWLEGQ
jgi:hypothetical protein